MKKKSITNIILLLDFERGESPFLKEFQVMHYTNFKFHEVSKDYCVSEGISVSQMFINNVTNTFFSEPKEI